MHKSWRVREEFARTVATAVSLFVTTKPTLQRVILPPVCVVVTISCMSFILVIYIHKHMRLTCFCYTGFAIAE